jgi:cobyrinic acid a,c-diamide synthase
MIAGTGSGCGKTTVTCALLAALTHLEKNVISFKCGPDYIDPMFHKKAAGVESRNLDVFLMGEAGVRYAVARHASNRDIAVMEGVMGFYDGLGGGSFASSNHVSVLTNTPVVLIVDARGAALSVCAVIKGFLEFEDNNIRAVILNNVSETTIDLYREMIEERLNVDVIGFLPHIPQAGIKSRHLGLVRADEIADIKGKINLLKEYALKYVDFDALLDITGLAETFDYKTDFLPSKKTGDAVKLYIACDEAFSFWYEHNHDLLKALGAEINFFSPLHDRELPNNADGLILWGGYPELYGPKLEGHTSMRHSLKTAINAGLPVYAECGGFMYLQQSLTDLQGNVYKMLGILPGNAKMTGKLQNFGYYKLEALKDNLLCDLGNGINAHFFHYATSDSEGDCFKAVKQGGKSFLCIVSEGNLFAGYQHLHFWGNPDFAKRFIGACMEYRNRRSTR